MNINLFKPISIRGRIAYGISCLHTYVTQVYPSEDFSSVLDLACQITEEADYIDISSQKYMEIIPEYLYEFDNFEEAEFEYLSEEAYKHFVTLIPADDNDLNIIMHAIWQIAWEYCYNSIDKFAKDTSNYSVAIAGNDNYNHFLQ